MHEAPVRAGVSSRCSTTRRRGGFRDARLLVAALVLSLGAAACVPRPREGVSPASGPAVVVISIDGLRADAIERAPARTLLRLLADAAYTMDAQTVLPSRTLPAHTSMVTGVTPLVHGITWNDDRTRAFGAVGTPTIFDHARAAALTSAGFFAKPKFRHLIRDDAPDFASAPRGNEIRSAARMVEDVERYLRFARPALLFVHLADADLAGHAFGWRSAPYRWAVRRADAAVARIIGAADRAYGVGGYTLIVTADHGGTRRDHGSAGRPDRAIPWLVWGHAARPGRIQGRVYVEDTAPTVLALLGLPIPELMSGRVIAEAVTVARRMETEQETALRADARRPAVSGCAAPAAAAQRRARPARPVAP